MLCVIANAVYSIRFIYVTTAVSRFHMQTSVNPVYQKKLKSTVFDSEGLGSIPLGEAPGPKSCFHGRIFKSPSKGCMA